MLFSNYFEVQLISFNFNVSSQTKYYKELYEKLNNIIFLMIWVK